jgi:hypothetical protein
MGPFQWFLFVYVLGGLTFVPLLIGSALLFAYYTLPHADDAFSSNKSNDTAGLLQPDDEDLVFRTGTDDLAEKFHRRHDSDVAAGYFAVCREWVPGGVNGKPPDKLSPAGETIATESPSVYQTMYRSLFDRSQKPTIEPSKDASGKPVRRANNIFYVVLRHGHLMLYDDLQQLEVRYVISLEYHDVDIYAGSDEDIPEGELWVKRHAIRLTRKSSSDPSQKSSLPFYLFGENLSEKEDFYHALLKNQERTSPDTPVAEDFDTAYIVKLVQKLHSSEEQLQTRWLNAMIGRLFLATYKTPEVEDFIRSKLTKKISRVKKPTFVTRITLLKIETGTGAPFVTNPRLKDLTVGGDCVAEADIEYTGGFRIEIGATARIDLGKRFGYREVDMVLACTLRKVQGHILFRFKPPPSNRIWFAFEKMPQMDLLLEPIVSSRKITYSVILGAIESRIREVFAESLVLPFWDDIPFLDTVGQRHRGGVWKREKSDTSVEIRDEIAEDEATTTAAGGDAAADIKSVSVDDRNFSTPAFSSALSTGLKQQQGDSKSTSALPGTDTAISDVEKTPPARPPRALRAMSFAHAADPAVTANNVDSDSVKVETPEATTPKRDSAAAFLKDLSTRGTSPPSSAAGSPPVESAMAEAMKGRSDSNASNKSTDSLGGPARASTVDYHTSVASSALSQTSRPSTPAESTRSSQHEDQKSIKSLSQTARSLTSTDRKQALASATAAAQKWGTTLGWGVLARNKNPGQSGDIQSPTTTDRPPSGPMGRGQPLPPPGQPLPGPKKQNLMANIPFMAPRKLTLPKRPEQVDGVPNEAPSKPTLPKRPDHGEGGMPTPGSKPPPLPDRRRRKSTMHSSEHAGDNEDLLVVEAPTDSTPASPEAERVNSSKDDFFGHEAEAARRAGLNEVVRGSNPSGNPDPKPNQARDTRQDKDKADDVSTPSPKDVNHNKDFVDSAYVQASSDASEDKENVVVHPTSGLGDDAGVAALAADNAVPRPPPPARTSSANSDRRSLTRIPAPVSPGLSSLKRRPLEMRRQSSNLSLASSSSLHTAGDTGYDKEELRP